MTRRTQKILILLLVMGITITALWGINGVPSAFTFWPDNG